MLQEAWFTFRYCLTFPRILENWPLVFLECMGLLRSEYEYRLRSGLRIIAVPGSLNSIPIQEIFLEDIYQCREGFKIMETDTVVDIGANIGCFALHAARLAKKGRVYAFEPVPATFSYLERNLSRNGARNVVPVRKGVTSDGKVRQITASKRNHFRSSLYLHTDDPNAERLIIDTASLAHIVSGLRKIDFLKIDAEGAEYEILMNAPKSAFGKISRIVIEYHNLDEKSNGATLAAFLKKSGYSVHMTGPFPAPGSPIGMIYAKLS
jgi:FkbM family methyltransferase